jgi:hypothetical protein
MNRRRFLSTMGAAIAALFVPEPAAKPYVFAIGPGGFMLARDYTRFMNAHDYNPLFSGEIGRYENVRFIEHTWVTDSV